MQTHLKRVRNDRSHGPERTWALTFYQARVPLTGANCYAEKDRVAESLAIRPVAFESLPYGL